MVVQRPILQDRCDVMYTKGLLFFYFFIFLSVEISAQTSPTIEKELASTLSYPRIWWEQNIEVSLLYQVINEGDSLQVMLISNTRDLYTASIEYSLKHLPISLFEKGEPYYLLLTFDDLTYIGDSTLFNISIPDNISESQLIRMDITYGESIVGEIDRLIALIDTNPNLIWEMEKKPLDDDFYSEFPQIKKFFNKRIEKGIFLKTNYGYCSFAKVTIKRGKEHHETLVLPTDLAYLTKKGTLIYGNNEKYSFSHPKSLTTESFLRLFESIKETPILSNNLFNEQKSDGISNMVYVFEDGYYKCIPIKNMEIDGTLYGSELLILNREILRSFNDFLHSCISIILIESK